VWVVASVIPARRATRVDPLVALPLRIGAAMFSILQDVRFGFRMLMKHRLATLVSIVALALVSAPIPRCSVSRKLS